MLEAFKRPRIQGKIRRRAHARLGRRLGQRAAPISSIENSYVFVTNATMTSGGARDPGRRSVLARISRAATAATRSTRACASRAGRWRIFGTPSISTTIPSKACVSGEYQLYGKYQTPLRLRPVEDRQSGTAYGETFDAATAALRFEGNGVRLDGIDIKKSTGGVTGAAWVGWDGTYSFNADGAKIPGRVAGQRRVSQSAALGPRAVQRHGRRHLRGAALRREARASTICSPATKASASSRAGCTLRGEMLTLDLEAASPRLVVSGSGRIALTPEMDAELTVRFRETSLDPVRALLRAAAVALHDGDRRRHHARRRRAGRISITWSSTRASSSSISSCSTIACKNDGPIELLLDRARHRDPELPPRRRRHAAAARRHRSSLHDKAIARRRRTATPTSGSCRASSAICAAAARRRSRRRCRRRSTTRCSPAARPSPTAASATSRCRTRSKSINGRLSFDAQRHPRRRRAAGGWAAAASRSAAASG